MKNSIKIISILFSIMLSLLLIFPLNAYASTEELQYFDVESLNTLDTEELSISGIKFKDLSTSSTQSFGISGMVLNNTNNIIEYKATVKFYDINKNLIAEGYKNNVLNKGYNSFIQMFNMDILNGHSVNEINFYTIDIEVTEKIEEENEITPSQNEQYKYFDYVIDKYNIDIVVNENNTFDITEKIEVFFNIPKHGIFRTIPLRNEVIREDGTSSKNRVQITDLDVNHAFTKSNESGNLKVKIGSASTTLTGKQEYVIKYKYNIGKDPVKDYDEIYLNIIGTEWDTVIGNVTFSITMPKEFDLSKFGFSSGSYGSTNNDNVKYSTSGNKITGSYDGILKAGEALTIRGELPEGYFVGAGHKINFKDYLLGFLPIIFLGISYLLWNFFGKDEPVVEVVEFYPPKGFNSLDIAYMYKGNADSKDATSLLIYLANKGYIKISETEKRTVFSKDGFKITKIKDYDGQVEEERLFLEGLFKKKSFNNLFGSSEKNDSFDEVTNKDLENSFYTTLNKILRLANGKKNKNLIFEKSSTNKRAIIFLMIIVSFCVITIPPLISYGMMEAIIFALIFPGIGFTAMFSILFSKNQNVIVNGKPTDSKFVKVMFALIFGVTFGGVPFISFVVPALKNDPIYFIIYVIGIACVLGMCICQEYVYKRTPYGNEMLGRILGFKSFLEAAEKDKLEALVMNDPKYFYDILPYTYVLDVSDKWIKKFETIAMQEPEWYTSTTGRPFSMRDFGKFVEDTMVSATTAMSSSPSSSSSGGSSSGGGFSGGGSGGGGGGSW